MCAWLLLSCEGGTLGPFKAQRQVEVPLWFALSLKRRRKCIVQPPAWLDAGSLADCLEEDRNTAPTATEPVCDKGAGHRACWLLPAGATLALA